jgi:hypothetical protein
VFCPDCRYNFFTMGRNPPCEEPLVCEHASEPLADVENMRLFQAGSRA